ncbi:MAG: PfkB family carbohydrate kinase, partial [Armatimonadota bacterium]|nr:PfkB family carbohydrate kinase [Armatimonadota bacterium]
VNYRAKLWTEEEAAKCLVPMMEYVDFLITTEEDTGKVFGIREADYQTVARKLVERFGFKVVAITLREDLSVLRNNWSAFALSGGHLYNGPTYTVEIIDRVGGGDSFSAGFIYGYLSGSGDVAKGVNYGVAFSALKHSIPGDLNWATLAEVENLLKGGGLRIQR